MARRTVAVPILADANGLLAALALLDFVVHMLIAGNYGYFRDELYYIAGGQHLAFGYVDFPPMIAVLAALMHALTGDNLIAIHVIPALAGSCLVFVSGLMARELGGGRFAQALAALAALVTLVFMATASIFSMDILDALWWALAALIIIRLIRHDKPGLWLLFGVVAGLGLLTKLTMLFFGFALVIGLLVTPSRAYFRTRWLWLGGLIALAMLLPYAVWNAVNGWPTLEFWRHYGGLTGGGPLGFLANQVVTLNPLTLPLTIAGLVFYFRTPAGKPYRLVGWAYVVLYVLFTLINAKAYFLAPAYPVLFAGGAVLLEQVVQQRKWRWLRVALPAALGASGVLLAPLAMPVLPPAVFADAYAHLTAVGNSGAGQQKAGVFPQYLGDRFGWETMTATVARAYEQLPAAERSQACIFTNNYGEASAISFLGEAYHLPPTLSGHNNYALWGPGTCNGAVVLTVGQTRQDDERGYASVVQVATTSCAYCMAYEDNLPVYLCTQPKAPLPALWATVKHFD
ncbi:MAG TPA: glycosyltransferase family 39 protein [Chloroflexota bacterium]|nr:glycosyltransferase family 39 protein [Chloroflexota bacterium]